MDQHYINHPEELFDRSTEDLMVDLDGKVILEAHLQCAAHEMPLTDEDEKYFGPNMKEICETKLEKDREGWYVSLLLWTRARVNVGCLVPQVPHAPTISSLSRQTRFNKGHRRGEVQHCGCHPSGQTGRYRSNTRGNRAVSRAV